MENTGHVPEALLSLMQRAYNADPAATAFELYDLNNQRRDNDSLYSTGNVDWGMVLLDLQIEHQKGRRKKKR